MLQETPATERLFRRSAPESATIAYSRKSDVDSNYARLVKTPVGGGAYAAVATHDDRLIEHALRVTDREGVGPDGFELQMLYGVRPRRQLELAGRGYKMLVATPSDPDSYPYLMRRRPSGRRTWPSSSGAGAPMIPQGCPLCLPKSGGLPASPLE